MTKKGNQWYNLFMFKQRIFSVSLIVLVVLAVMHFLGIKFEIYFYFEKYDIPMHILGGLWVALTVFWLTPYFSTSLSIKNYKIKSFFFALIIVLIMATVWEVFELASGITSTSDDVFLGDTVGDYICAIVGLFLGFVYFLNQKKCMGTVCELVNPVSLNSLK